MALGKLGRYDIIRILGKGAMGMVYEGRDPNLERRVAIKTIKVDSLSQEATAEYEARFRTEARSAARLQHPHIVSVYDSGRHDDMAYLVMEFVQGDDLKQLLDRGITFSLAQVTHMMRDLLSALDYAHRQKIVHRDVKPANLLVEADGRIKLTDFGVARIQDAGDATRTRGSMVGTLKYMAPEQVQGLVVDARADIFAAGVVLYQLLTGQRPFGGDSEFAIIQQIVAASPPPPSTVNAQLSPAIDAVVAQALAPSREQRFSSAQAFAVALQAAVDSVADQTIVPPPGRRPSNEWGGSGVDAMRQSGRSGGSSVASLGDTSGSTVTQELELVYWKDIKDSEDAIDLQGFLRRFPHGIYGDLARRRLKRMGALEYGEQTGTELQTRAMDPAASHIVSANTDSLTEKTLLIERAAAGVDSPSLSQDDQTVAVPVTVGAAPDRPVIGAESAPPPSAVEATLQASSAASVPGHVSEQPETADHGLASATRTQPIKRLALLASLLVAVALALWRYAPAPGPQTAQTDGPSGIAATYDGGAGVVAAPRSDPVAARSVSGKGRAVAPSSTATRTATPAAPGRTEPAVAQGKSAVAATSPAPSPAASAPAAASPLPLSAKPVQVRVAEPLAAVGGASVSPEKACEGRVLLGFQSCMNTQCALAEFAGHAVCRQRRMADQARDAQNNGRN